MEAVNINLSKICRELKNYFINGDSDKHAGTYTIKDGVISDVDFLIEGQYFAIKNSKLNDGVYQYTDDDMKRLKDETFTGSVWDMRVPPDFLDWCADVDKFNAKVDEMGLKDKGYSSESFGGYAYQISASSPAYMIEWKSRIDREAAMWRKLNNP